MLKFLAKFLLVVLISTTSSLASANEVDETRRLVAEAVGLVDDLATVVDRRQAAVGNGLGKIETVVQSGKDWKFCLLLGGPAADCAREQGLFQLLLNDLGTL